MGYSETRDSVTALVKEQADIVQIIGEVVDLKRAGSRFLGLCPFHGEKTPSFSVSPQHQVYHCFGCGESGDVFSFLMKHHSLDFPTALKTLAARYNIELPEKQYSQAEQKKEDLRKALFAVNDKAATIYREYLLQNRGAADARAYLERRAIPLEMQEKFRLGYAPNNSQFLGNIFQGEEKIAAETAGLIVKKEDGSSYDKFRDRILFPIFDIRGRISGFGGRLVHDVKQVNDSGFQPPKYMNSPESPVFDKSRSLLGLFQQAAAIRARQQVALVEGNFDMLSLVAHGYPNVVAPLGTALTRPQLKMLRHYAENAILLFDGDAAGIKAAVRAVPLFLAEQMGARVALLPDGHDPDSFIREQGLKKMEQLLDEATPLAEFALNKLIEEHGLSLDGKGRIIRELQPLVQAAADPMQRALVISHFSDRLGLDAQEFKALLTAHLPGPAASPEVVQQQTLQTMKTRQLAAEAKSHLRLNPTQIRLITHTVLFPAHFSRLEEAGVRQQLAGGLGEVIFLQLKELHASSPSFEPEDLLVALPDGEERAVVERILQSASSDLYRGTEEELAELLLWLKQGALQRVADELQKEIFRTEQAGGDVGDLMLKKQQVVVELQRLKEPLR